MSQIWQEDWRNEEELSGVLATADVEAKIHYKYALEKTDRPARRGDVNKR